MQAALVERLEADATLAAAVVADGKARIHWTHVPQGSALPYLRLQTISDPRPQHLRGYHGSQNTRVRVDVFAKTYAQARSLAIAVIAAVAEPVTVGGVKFGRVKVEGPRDLGEETSSGFVHRLSLDLLVEHSLA